MDKPLCRLCNKKHWSHEAHVWPDKDDEVIGEFADVADVMGALREPDDDVIPDKPKFDRVAYQREYMRKWRKK